MTRRGYSLVPQSPSPVGDRRSRSVLTTSSITVTSLAPEVVEEIEAEEDAHAGVRAVEAAKHVFGRTSRWSLFTGIALASYVYSLDNQTTSNYLAFATSHFGAHSLISSLQVAQSIIVACGKPVIAKVADVTSRGTAYVVVLVFYVLGYIVIALSPNVGAVAAGIVLYAIGYTGLQLLTSVIIADITTLQWRGIVTGMTSLPFLVNAFVGANLSSFFLEHLTWRWGYAMFAILVPMALSPLIITLFWGEHKAKKLGLMNAPTHSEILSQDKPTRLQRAWRFAEQLDLVGLILLGGSIAMILLPMTLAQRSKGQWSSPPMLAMFIGGWIFLPVFALWDLRYAKRPVIARRFLANRTVVCAAWIGFFDFLSYFLTYTYLSSFVLVTKPWSMTSVFYFGQIQTLGLTFFGIIAGIMMRFLHRYKWILFCGLCIRLVGVALMIHSRGADGSDAELVWTQVLQGMGGGFAAICSGIGAQASVPHADVAMITALVLLWTEIGAGVGGSIAGAIWSGAMPGALKEHLPGLTQEERDALFGSITDVRARPLGDPVRQGVIAAYSDTMKTMLIAATVLSVVPVGLALLMPDWYLGDQQNAVYDADAGRRSARTSTYVGEEGVDEVVSDEDEEDVEEEQEEAER
ncbi:drug:h+ antiporter [Trametes versicolor FP-101664 SS1]|uniref:drug:h+ antiporter n=1 Tax=Trametes versicolor (strain FP-101664) TaxID=717944 RepID=UPI0004623343|nr:drug:h+ antiporter [Trametes versicolor FP-101664 SS1]EIW58899.1 drug:h+ antiporter [Trametes versicolor FP-101664 SS1]